MNGRLFKVVSEKTHKGVLIYRYLEKDTGEITDNYFTHDYHMGEVEFDTLEDAVQDIDRLSNPIHSERDDSPSLEPPWWHNR